MRVPHSFAQRMKKGDPGDPLLNQVLPKKIEYNASVGFTTDPVGDSLAMPAPGLLHKYHGRVLLVATGACAIHCRYCFRKHFPYSSAKPNAQDWRQTLDYIASDTSIKEVILSGGDPLTLSDARLASLIKKLEKIGHLERLRIHTRLPIVLPERIDQNLIDWLGGTRFATIIVIHANHPNEIDQEVIDGLERLMTARVTLLNQSVLLKDINDHVEILATLSEKLFEAGVLPYYLHQLDKVQGAAHFEVSDEEASRIHQQLMAKLPGYLVPRLVREQAGQAYKTPIT